MLLDDKTPPDISTSNEAYMYFCLQLIHKFYPNPEDRVNFTIKLARLNPSEHSYVAIPWRDGDTTLFFEFLALVKVGVNTTQSIPRLYYPIENTLYSKHLLELDFEYLGLIIICHSGSFLKIVITLTPDKYYLFLRDRNTIPKFV